MNILPENISSASVEDHSRAENWDRNDQADRESSAASIYAQGGLSRLQTYAANQDLGKKVTASWRAALAMRDAGPPAMLRSVRPNIVQSIRAFRTSDLAEAANELGQHFVYAACTNANTKGEVLEAIANAYMFTKQQAKNFDPLLDALTTLVDKAGPQPGFVGSWKDFHAHKNLIRKPARPCSMCFVMQLSSGPNGACPIACSIPSLKFF